MPRRKTTRRKKTTKRKRAVKKTAKKRAGKKTARKFKKGPASFPLQKPRGTFDILPKEEKYWRLIRENSEEITRFYGFERIDLPFFERKEIFERGIGRTTDIVEKELYTFKDKSGCEYALRPEATASIARAYIENGMFKWPQPIKLFVIGPMFRHDRPQKGRQRQFYQFDLEIIGSADPITDAELIRVVLKIYETLGLEDLSLEINSIGCAKCRPDFLKTLKDYYKINQKSLCYDCKHRFKINPFRLLDCKEDKCEQLANRAPLIIDNLCDDCHSHFKKVLEYLDELSIAYSLNTRLVRGLDYYTKTVFEIWPKKGHEKSSQNSLGGGGRFDGLIEELGGKDTPAVGFAGGIERIIEEMKRQEVTIKEERPDVFLAQIGDGGKKRALKFYDELIEAGLNVSANFSKESIKSQLGLADKEGVKWSLILGQKEAIDKTVIFRNMESGMQEIVDQDRAVKELKKRLKKASL